MEKIINSYESLFIADLENGETAAKETVSKFIDLIEQNGEVVEVNKWGRRRLAYPINDKSEGYYTVVTFKSAPEFPTELERLYNIDEQIMRSMTLKLDHEAVAPQKAAAPVVEKVAVAPEAKVETEATVEVEVENEVAEKIEATEEKAE